MPQPLRAGGFFDAPRRYLKVILSGHVGSATLLIVVQP